MTFSIATQKVGLMFVICSHLAMAPHHVVGRQKGLPWSAPCDLVIDPRERDFAEETRKEKMLRKIMKRAYGPLFYGSFRI
jgi:hypothetical protein